MKIFWEVRHGLLYIGIGVHELECKNVILGHFKGSKFSSNLISWKIKGLSNPFQKSEILHFLRPGWRYSGKMKEEIGNPKPIVEVHNVSFHHGEWFQK